MRHKITYVLDNWGNSWIFVKNHLQDGTFLGGFLIFFRNRLKIIKFVNISKSSIPLESILNINLQLKARGIFMGHTTMSKNMVWAFSGRMTPMLITKLCTGRIDINQSNWLGPTVSMTWEAMHNTIHWSTNFYFKRGSKFIILL